MASIYIFQGKHVLGIFGPQFWGTILGSAAVIVHCTRMKLTRCHLGWQLVDRRRFQSGRSRIYPPRAESENLPMNCKQNGMRIRSSSSYCMSYEFYPISIFTWVIWDFLTPGIRYDLPRLLPPDDVQTPVADDETEDSSMVSTPGFP